MCIRLLSKTLNPKAKEWRPTPKQPHPPPPPPPQPAALIHTPHYYHLVYHQGAIQYSAYTQCRPLIYNAPFPPAQDIDFCKAALTANSKLEVEKVSYTEGKKMEGPRAKSPKCPPVDHVFKDQGFKRAYPPRLRSLQSRFSVDKRRRPPSPPLPPQHRREWRPRNSEKAGCKSSGDGGAAHLPPPSDYRCRVSQSKNTTVMIKNIPNRLSRRDFMLKFLDDYCKTYSLEYDFLYLPIDFRKKGNLGYAFVNFTSAVAAIKFKSILQNFKWAVVYAEGGPFNSNKICDVTWARIQGRKALIERFEKSSFACDRLDFLPVILDPPRNGSDPNPSPPVILGSLDRSILRKTN